MKRRVTLQQIAKACGVTASAVSYALRGRPEVSEALRTRIVEAAQALGYVPSGAARRLRGTSSAPQRIGVVAPMPGMPAYARNLELIDRACAARGLETVMQYHYWHEETEERILKSLLDSGIDGLILHPAGRETGAVLSRLARGGLAVPFTAFGELAVDAGATPFHRGNFYPHPQMIADLCIPQLVARGHRRIAFLFQGPLLPEGRVVQTLRQFRAKGGAGVEMEFFYLDDSSSPIRAKVLEKKPCGIHDFVETDRLLANSFLESGFEATVAMTQDDLTALALLSGCQQRGRSVPESLSLISIGGSYVCGFGGRTITHLAVETDAIVEEMLGRLLAKKLPGELDGPYPLTFVEGETLSDAPVKTGKPPRRTKTGQTPLLS